MPKKSLVINGFLGGINEDADLSDLESENPSGKNELAVCDNAICNMPGKIEAKTITTAAGEGGLTVHTGTATVDTQDFLVYGDKFYNEQGVYKVGSDIEWSGKTTINRPLASILKSKGSSVQEANSVGLEAHGISSGADLNIVFMGKMASQNSGDCLIANTSAILPQEAADTHYISFDVDGNAPYYENNQTVGYDTTNSLEPINYHRSNWTIGLWDESASPAYNFPGFQADPSNGSAIADTTSSLAECDYIRFGRWGNHSTSAPADPALLFKVGQGSTNAAAHEDGLYGTGLNVVDKDIYIECSFNGNTTGDYNAGNFASTFNGTVGWERMVIVLDCDDINNFIQYNHDVATDALCKIYRVTRGQLGANQCVDTSGDVTANQSKGRVKIPYDSATYTGDDFNAADVKNIWIIIEGADTRSASSGIDSQSSRWCFKLYELSFLSGDNPGWVNTNTKFIQTRVKDDVESLLQPYSGYQSLISDNTMSITVAEPTTANYEGKLYFQDADDNGIPVGSLFLLAYISQAKGVKSILSEYYQQWVDNKSSFVLADPPISSTYKLEAGYPTDTVTINAKWFNAVTVGRQVYIGDVIKTGDDLHATTTTVNAGTLTANYPIFDTTGFIGTAESTTIGVKIRAATHTFDYDSGDGSGYNGSVSTISASNAYQVPVGETDGVKVRFPSSLAVSYTVGDEWQLEIKREKDLILKGTIGKKYGFSDLNYIDLEIPNSGITAMESVGDRLFVFSDSILNIVNIAQDFEFLEGTFQGLGITAKMSVCKVLEGLAFVNETGVYYFDGTQMNNLSDDLMMSHTWSNGLPIGYLPSKKLICVWHTVDNVLSYSIPNKAWVSDSIGEVVPESKIAYYNNKPHFLWTDTSTVTLQQISFGKSGEPDIYTGKISCGDLSRNKKFKKVYVTTKFTSGTLAISYFIDGGGAVTTSGLSEGIHEISINTSGKVIQFRFVTSSINADFEISDISLIYRNKTVK